MQRQLERFGIGWNRRGLYFFSLILAILGQLGQLILNIIYPNRLIFKLTTLGPLQNADDCSSSIEAPKEICQTYTLDLVDAGSLCVSNSDPIVTLEICNSQCKEIASVDVLGEMVGAVYLPSNALVSTVRLSDLTPNEKELRLAFKMCNSCTLKAT